MHIDFSTEPGADGLSLDVVAVLVRRLGGTVTVTEAEIAELRQLPYYGLSAVVGGPQITLRVQMPAAADGAVTP